jgi:hypothetical protein
MNREQVEKFTAEWADAWNARDVEKVLLQFDQDLTFTSPTALAVVGTATVKGKDALRAYWNTALQQITTLRFVVERVLWDPVSRELSMIYRSEINGHSKKVAENLTFGENDLVVSAEVFHGIS